MKIASIGKSVEQLKFSYVASGIQNSAIILENILTFS